ncbi:MAG: NAD(P)H-hydrate dehydratase [Chlorobi bacterium]|nr:NAD(P)H-hydrate dehydratase [Chlorobiota bacterium]
MKPAFTFDEIREAEKTIIERDGVPSLLLMENAGKNSFELIFPKISDYEVYILTGKGNNAGDGFVIARHIAINSIEANIVFVSEPAELKGDALENFDILKKLESELINFISFDEFKKSVKKSSKLLIIDAILGSGVSGKLIGNFESAINLVNKLKSINKKLRIVSVDVPSGLMSGEQVNPIINADYTITMGAVKTEMLYGEGKDNCGEISVVPIGISDDLIEKYNSYNKYIAEFDDVKKLYPRRRKSSYKYSNGKALIIGGSAGLSGAVIMSSLSALKSGAGAVLAAFPKSISSHFSKKLYEVIKTELDETADGSIAKDSYDAVKKRIDKADAVLIGPGLSLNPETKSFLFDVIKNCRKNLIIDADGLTLLAEDTTVLLRRNSESEIILTPHIGEFSRLSGIDSNEIALNRFETVIEFSSKYKVNIVMKSETTFSCLTNGKIFINPTGNELLASAGSGDVLSGILVSLLAQTGDVYRAVVCGNYLHGILADLYAEKHGNKQSASQQDLIKLIPKAISEILS